MPYQVIVLGNKNVGKTELTSKFLNGKKVGQVVCDGITLEVELLDQSNSVTKPISKRKLSGALIVYDITNEESFKDAEKWIMEVRELDSTGIPIALIGNKADLEQDRKVEAQVAQEFALKQNVLFFEISAKTGQSIDDAFFIIVSEMLIIDSEGGLPKPKDDSEDEEDEEEYMDRNRWAKKRNSFTSEEEILKMNFDGDIFQEKEVPMWFYTKKRSLIPLVQAMGSSEVRDEDIKTIWETYGPVKQPNDYLDIEDQQPKSTDLTMPARSSKTHHDVDPTFLFSFETLKELFETRWFHPAARVSDNVLSQEDVGSYLVRPSTNYSKSFSLEIKGEFTIEKIYIKRAKNGYFYGIGSKSEFIGYEATIQALMAVVKEFLKKSPFELKRPCPKPFFIQTDQDSSTISLLSGYFSDLDLKEVTSDTALLTYIGNNRRRFCSQFEELVYREDLYGHEGIPTEFGTRILKSLHDNLTPLQIVLTALLKIDIPNSCMSKLIAIATNKGLQKAFPNIPILSQSIYNPNRLSLSIPKNDVQKRNSLIGSLPVEQSVKFDAAINSTASASSSNSKLQDWTVEEVIKWVNSLKLSVSYDAAIQSNALDGNALCSIEGDDDIKEIWTDLGMAKVGDKLKLKRAIKILISTQKIH